MKKKNNKNNGKKIRTVHVERITDKDVNNINIANIINPPIISSNIIYPPIFV